LFVFHIQDKGTESWELLQYYCEQSTAQCLDGALEKIAQFCKGRASIRPALEMVASRRLEQPYGFLTPDIEKQIFKQRDAHALGWLPLVYSHFNALNGLHIHRCGVPPFTTHLNASIAQILAIRE
jgi:hypothetical protein